MSNENKNEYKIDRKTMYEAAKFYTEHGWIIHAVSKPNSDDDTAGKAPISTGWQKHPNPRTDLYIERHWGDGAEQAAIPYNIGLQTGPSSDVDVLDLDDDNPFIIGELIAGLNKDNWVKQQRTPRRAHLFFKHTDKVPKEQLSIIGVDYLTDGKNCILEPSNHKTGDVYKFSHGRPAGSEDLPEMPEELINRLNELFKLARGLQQLVNKCRPCIKQYFNDHAWNTRDKNNWHTDEGRKAALATCTELAFKGASFDQLILMSKIMYREDWDAGVSETQINSVLEYIKDPEHKPWKCETIQNDCHIICGDLCENCKKKDRPGKASKIKVVNDSGEIESSKAAKLSNMLSDCFLEKYSAATLVDGGLRIYNKGIYQICKNKYLTNNLMVELAGELGLLVSPKELNDALEMVKSKTPAAETETPLNLIPVNNGVLNIDTMELIEYSPENVFISKFPVNYNPNARRPVKFFNMLDTTFAGVEHQINEIQELFGYCFLRSYFLEAVWFMIGDGQNGKSTMLNILTALLGGDEHVSHLTFKEISEPKNEHVLLDLFGKHANICGDTGKGRIKETDNLKKLTGNDTKGIRVRPIYKEAFNFTNFAKIILAFNKLPEVDDFSTGFKRRIRLIEFPNQFDELAKDTNKNLATEIIEDGELEGILLWALDGLKRILKEKKLSNTKSVALRGLEYEKKSNPMSYFVRECLLEDEGGFIPKIILMAAFNRYARYNKLPQLTPREFKAELIRECKEIGINTWEKRNQKRKDRAYGFVNIKIDQFELMIRSGATKAEAEKAVEHAEQEEQIDRSAPQTKFKETIVCDKPHKTVSHTGFPFTVKNV